MDGELAQGALGSIAKYDVSFKGGALVAELSANVGVGGADLIVKIDALKVMDALAAAIPGTIDDAVLGLIKAALTTVK